jgi:hypothetical protein
VQEWKGLKSDYSDGVILNIQTRGGRAASIAPRGMLVVVVVDGEGKM